MRHFLAFASLFLATCPAGASGLLIPEDKSLPPLAMLTHRVSITMEDQVTITKLDQVFRNHTNRQLEATYVFPVPKGASVNRFSMWVNGQEAKGELLEATKARQVYEDIVRRTNDPGLLEYMGQGLFRVRVFPVPAMGEQKISLSYSGIAARDQNIVEFTYPLKTDGKSTSTLKEFSIQAVVKSQLPIQNIYSPTHAITVQRQSDREVRVEFEKHQYLLDRDFQLFYATGGQDVGLSMLTHRPIPGDKGYALVLVSPRLDLSKAQTQPRDMVFVVDTSGSMRGAKMDQAKRALKYCLDNLNVQDRFAVLNFSTSVNRYRDGLSPVTSEHLDQARKWVDALESTGGTAIRDALNAALDLRTSEISRTFTMVFFTDGLPTVGETNADKILAGVLARNSAGTRIFTFGVGYDVNASFLDRLADETRAVSTYVKPAEDIEGKVSSLYAKISNPVLANLRLTSVGDFRFEEVFPPQLPDLFHGGQLVVLGRFSGKGEAKLVLSGMLGAEKKELSFDLSIPDKTKEDRSFVEHLWARRKVGYLLDQIRANGEKKELVDETVALAKKYGIATPYTSYLVVPDSPTSVAGLPQPHFGAFAPTSPAGAGGGAATRLNVADFARQSQKLPGDLGKSRMREEEKKESEVLAAAAKSKGGVDPALARQLNEAGEKRKTFEDAKRMLSLRRGAEVQSGKLGVELSTESINLKNQVNLVQTAQRNVQGRNCVELAGAWIDEMFLEKTPVFTIQAQSNAYFRLLALKPEMKEVLALGNAVVWISPSGTALVIDPKDGMKDASDDELRSLFIKK